MWVDFIKYINRWKYGKDKNHYGNSYIGEVRRNFLSSIKFRRWDSLVMYEFRHERIDKKDNFIYYLKALEFRYNFMDR
jgi:hypothetical protein